MIRSTLDAALFNQREYVLKAANALGYGLELVEHEGGTHTCEQRAELLGVPLANIVKSLYFSNGSEYIGVIGSGDTNRIVPRDLLPEILGMSRSRANKYTLREDRMPAGMSYGSCTPFPLESSLENEVRALIFVPNGAARKVYMPLGEIGALTHQVSLALPSFESVYGILKHARGSIVKKA